MTTTITPEALAQGRAAVEAALRTALRANPKDAPFPLDRDEAAIWHQASAAAYQHALEMLPALPELLAAQPASSAGGQEPVAWHIEHPDGLVALRKRDSVDEHMVKQAAADGVVIRPLVFGDAAPVAGEAAQVGAFYVCPVCHGPGVVTKDVHDQCVAPPAPAVPVDVLGAISGLAHIALAANPPTARAHIATIDAWRATGPQPAAQGVDLRPLLRLWEERSRGALPADAMLINKHVRELREALSASQQHQQKESGNV